MYCIEGKGASVVWILETKFTCFAVSVLCRSLVAYQSFDLRSFFSGPFLAALRVVFFFIAFGEFTKPFTFFFFSNSTNKNLFR